MPRYQQATTFDFVRSVKNTQGDVRQLQVLSPAMVRKTINQVAASLNANPYFWGGDSSGWNGLNGSLTVVSDPPVPSPYPYAALFTIATAGVGAALEQSGMSFLVIPSQQYLVSAWVNTPTTSCVTGVDWLDSTHTYISTSTTPVSVAPNTWTQVSASVVAPSNAAFAYPRLAPSDGVGNYIYATAITTQLTTQGLIQGPADTWHAVSLPGTCGLHGTARRKLLPTPNFAGLDLAVRWTNTAGATFSFGHLP